METELKLSFSNPDEMFPFWNRFFIPKTIPGTYTNLNLETEYFDTSELFLQQQKMNLRVRKIREHRFEHTVKMKIDEKNGLHRRYEWEITTERELFDIDFFLQEVDKNGDSYQLLENKISHIKSSELKRLFKSRFKRDKILIQNNISVIEAVADTGKIISGAYSECFNEIELELKSGEVSDVISLGDSILSSTNAKLDNCSKYQRGIRLLKEIRL